MSFFSFGNKPQAPQQQQNPANNTPNNNNVQNGQNNQQQQPGQPGQPNNPNAKVNEPANPLDVYSKMFDNPSNTEAAPSFSIDPKVMDQVVGSQDFMQGVDPELMQKATSGDTQALLQLINHSTRNAYRAAIEHGGVLTDKFVGAREQHSQKGFSSRVKQELTTNALSKTPNFQHPVVRKQLTEVAQRLQSQHPDASPEEIAEMSKDYLTQLAGALNPEDPSKKGGNKPEAEERGEDYWNNFFAADQNNG